MKQSSSKPADVPSSWDSYWQGSSDTAAFASGGAQHPALAGFWQDFFTALRERNPAPRILDVAGGNGAVIRHALAVFGDSPPALTCVDISAGAIDTLAERFPGVTGIVSDARKMPLASASFDAVTSQFGVEYAGVAAISEAARLVDEGGRLGLLLHHRGGGIHAECTASLAAVQRMQRAAFLPKAIRVFEAGFAALRGGSRSTYEAAVQQMKPAFEAMEAIMAKHGRHVAGDSILKLCTDVGHIHRRLQHYDPAEVLGWLRRMQRELGAYAGRMESMQKAALDATAFARVCERLEQDGFRLEHYEALTPADATLPLAWALVAEREAAT